MGTPARHERITQLFLAACEMARDARGPYLDRECGNDAGMRREVEAMLAHDEDPPKLLETPALGPEFEILWRAPASDHPADSELDEREALRPVSARPSHPSRLGRYRIIDLIGEGGVGVVYLAEQESPSRRVALKVLGPGSLSRRMLQRFEHEADILGRLRHPGIAQIYEAGVANAGFGPQPFFAMEYVNGHTLTEYSAARDASHRERLELLVQVCAAVHHAHQKGVVHRDLKPANIVVDDSGQARILDFGVARVTDADVHATTMHTERGQLLGTVPYMSPEQAAGDVRAVDVRSDVYALGVIAYELLTGRLPYDVEHSMLHEIIRAIQDVEPVALGALDRSLRGDLETIVAKALAKDPERRYQSASDLAADITRFLGHEPIAARPASSAYRLRRFARRHRAIVAGGAVAALAIALGLGATAWQAVTAQHERNRALEAERRAEQRFDQVRTLANRLIFEVHDEIVTLPGTTNARKVLIATAVQYLDVLAAEASDDLTLMDELADGYLKVGRALGGPQQANLGDKKAALENCEKALAIRRKLLLRAPDDHDARLDVAAALRETANLLAVTGETVAAMTRHEQAVELAREVLSAEAGHQGATREVASNLGVMGRLASKLGDTDRALELLTQAVALAQTLCDASPDDAERIFVLRGSLNQLAKVQQWSGRTAEALANFRRSLELAERLRAIDPVNTRHRRALFNSHLGLGDVLSNTGRPEEALVQFEEALRVVREAVEIDPNDKRAHQDMGFACEQIGYIHLEGGWKEAAFARFEEGRAARAAVVAASPEDREASHNLAISTIQVGEALSSLGRREEALVRFEEALVRTETLQKDDPADSWNQYLLCATLENVGKTLAALGRLDEADAAYGRMQEVAAALVRLDPGSAENLGLLAHAARGLGEVRERRMRYDEALTAYRESLRIRQSIADEDPANASARLKVARSHEDLGHLLGFLMSRPGEGLDHFRSAIAIRESVAPADPEAPAPTSALALDHERSGRLLRATGSVSEAIVAIETCVELYEMAARADPGKPRAGRLARGLTALISARIERAGDATVPAAQRASDLQAARGLYERAASLLDESPADDEARRLRDELDACQRALADLAERLDG